MNHRKLLPRGTATEPTTIRVLGGGTPRLLSNRASTSPAIRLKCPRLEPRCDLRMESGAYRMAPSRIPRSNWGDSSSWNSPRLTQRSIGQSAARQPRPALLRSAPSRRNPSDESRDERKRAGSHTSDDRASSPGVIRPSGGLPFLEYTRRGHRGGCSQRRIGSGTRSLAERRRAAKSGGLAADDSAPLLYRSGASSESR